MKKRIHCDHSEHLVALMVIIATLVLFSDVSSRPEDGFAYIMFGLMWVFCIRPVLSWLETAIVVTVTTLGYIGEKSFDCITPIIKEVISRAEG